MNNQLLKLIIDSQQNDERSMLELIKIFLPLKKKYANKLDYEDAVYDLLLEFIILIKNPNIIRLKSQDEYCLLSYIKQSMVNSYIALSKKHKKDCLCSSLYILDPTYEEDYNNKLDFLLFTNDDYVFVEYDFIFNSLTPYEAKIIILYFYYGFSVKEISKVFSVSLPAISQAKQRATKKLTAAYDFIFDKKFF